MKSLTETAHFTVHGTQSSVYNPFTTTYVNGPHLIKTRPRMKVIIDKLLSQISRWTKKSRSVTEQELCYHFYWSKYSACTPLPKVKVSVVLTGCRFLWGSVGVKNPRHRSLLNIYRYLVNIDRNLLEMAIHLNIDRFLLEKCQFVSARQRDYGFRMLWCAWLGKSEGQPTVSHFRTSRPISPEYVMQPEIPLWSVKPSWFYHVCSITSTSKRGLAK